MATPEKVIEKGKASRIKEALTRNKSLKQSKHVWNTHWQTIGEFFLTRKAIFTSKPEQGAFLENDLFDGTGPGALFKMASAMVGMLWPGGARSFVLKPIREIKETDEVKTYFEKVSERLADAMDDPRAGLQIAIDEYMIDQGAFGTSGISIMPGIRSHLSYKAENVKFMCIEEGPDGFIDTVYIEMEWAITKAVKQYGLKQLHSKTQELFRKGKGDEKINILFVVQPRIDVDKNKEGLLSMDFQSMHIEVAHKHMIREQGFYEMPVKVARFRKALNEVFGRSPAMEALPDVQELNALIEIITLGSEKNVDPPLAVYDDGVLGSNEIDTSAGALNVFNIAGRPANVKDPIVPVFTVGDLRPAAGLIERLENSIAGHFMLDRLLDFNNENVMTLGEVNIRNRIRGFLLGSIFARQVAELFDPLIERSFNILFDLGLLGVAEGSPEHNKLLQDGSEDILVIPSSVANLMIKDKKRVSPRPPFKVQYISPAARILQSEQAQGIIQITDYVITASQIFPEAVDNLEMDRAIKTLSEIYGVPLDILDSSDNVESKREGREEAIQQAQKLKEAVQGSQAVERVAKAGSYGLVNNGQKRSA